MKKTNRQKKELLKKIEEMKTWIDLDMELGCGFAPPGAYDETYKEIRRLQEELARLMHYKNVEEMYYDERGQRIGEKIPQSAESAQSQKQKLPRSHSKGMER